MAIELNIKSICFMVVGGIGMLVMSAKFSLIGGLSGMTLGVMLGYWYGNKI